MNATAIVVMLLVLVFIGLNAVLVWTSILPRIEREHEEWLCRRNIRFMVDGLIRRDVQ